MFYLVSKTAGFFAVPSNDILLVMAAGVLLLATRFVRAGRQMVLAGTVLLALAGLSPLGNVLMLPLEQRFPAWHGNAAPDGIVVLGGFMSPSLSLARGTAALNESAERITALAELARRFPQARIVLSGGNASLLHAAPGEAVLALPLAESFGIARSRIEIEDRSVNTDQNARLSKELAKPKPGELWLLVTSAHHMPRAVGCFRRAGFAVEAYPVDFRTRGIADVVDPFGTVSGGLARTDVAVREWIGLLTYWLAGKTSALLPGPGG